MVGGPRGGPSSDMSQNRAISTCRMLRARSLCGGRCGWSKTTKRVGTRTSTWAAVATRTTLSSLLDMKVFAITHVCCHLNSAMFPLPTNRRSLEQRSLRQQGARPAGSSHGLLCQSPCAVFVASGGGRLPQVHTQSTLIDP